MFIGTSGVVGYKTKGGIKEFLKVKEIYRERSNGSYLALDVDVKTIDGIREVKLFKSKPVVECENVKVIYDKKRTTVIKNDGTVVIDVEQLDPLDESLPNTGPVRQALDANLLDGIIRITGNFSVGEYSIKATIEKTEVGGVTMNGNLSVGTGGIVLDHMGISF